ncbi:FemAB family PEP-CTERM system-associated protein [Alteromonas sp. ASW11-36]|uniref:FemAB family PEP-CTERM system-associated protein n=1 Tax=Alteromonas arenosi TaxID=3055817 RepID=A0ABT7STW2_9ALTE|nr:FemAB family XrtA/PEP-CTERM system-associated protein [Alteromonas sp. ASW11-36]MDM7859627.1 FemAB family PEP-CTERM system-associated protein [Alteromonas sp. ASW11-36]
MTLNELKSDLKQLKKQKGAVSKQFKSVAKGSAEHTALLEQMRAVSSSIKATEEQIKAFTKPSLESQAGVQHAEQFSQPTATYGGTITLCIANQEQVKAFWAWQKTQARSSVYHTQAIFEWLDSAQNNQCVMLLALDEKENILGGLPITIMRTRLFGHFAISQPFFNYGGPLTDYVDVFEQLLDFAEQWAFEMHLDYVEIRTLTPSDKRSSSNKKVSMVLPLANSTDELRQSFGAKVRAQVNKANEFSPSVTFGGDELLNDFYHVLSTNMRDLGTPLYEKAWFKSLIDVLPKRAHLCVVYVTGKPVAASFLIKNSGVMEIPWASTLRKVNHMNINMWMYDQILAFAIEQRCGWFDFGRSTSGAGTYRFKKQWGAKPVQHYWYTLGRDNTGVDDGLNPDNPKFKLAIAIWQRLPVWVTRIIGPLVAKQLP